MKPINKCILLSICFALCVTIIAAFFYSDTIQSYFEPSYANTHTIETIESTSPGKPESKKKAKKKVKKNNNSSKVSQSITYILNTNTHRFHYSDCRYVDTIADHNSETYTGNRDSITETGYVPCKICNP